MNNLKFTILGSGCSFGVPYPGNHGGKCDPSNPKNRRMRCSLLVQSDTTNIVVDTGQDFREQTNINEIKYIDAVLYSHKHPDHTAGIDDMRMFAIRVQNTIPAYMDDTTYEYLARAKDYLIKQENIAYPPIITPHILSGYETFSVGDIDVSTHILDHGTINSTGFRFGDVAYSLDMKDIHDERTFTALEGIGAWIVDAGGFESSENPVHASFEHIMNLNKRIKAKRVIFTSHTNHIDYDTISAQLPDGYELAYDGQVL